MLLAILFFSTIVCAQSLNCGALKDKPQCSCFLETHLAVCRSQVEKVPFFGDYLLKKLKFLDLRYNRVSTLNNSRQKELSEFLQIDLRNNPIDCTLLPDWNNVVSDCKESTTMVTVTEASFTYSSTSFSTSKIPHIENQSEFWINVTITPALLLYCIGTIIYLIKKKVRQCLRNLLTRMDHDLEMQGLLDSTRSTSFNR